MLLTFLPVLGFALVAPPSPRSPDVVELKDGTRIVGELRPQAERGAAPGELLLATRVGEQRFAEAAVARVERRADLLKSYRATLDGAGDQPHALRSLSQWCLERGLYPEAFDLADRFAALTTDAALVEPWFERLAEEALLDGSLPGVAPDTATQERLLARVIGRSASRSRYAKAVFDRLPPTEREPFLMHELEDSHPDVRCGAAAVLGARPTPLSTARLIRSSLFDANGVVREHARTAALASNHPQIAVPYLKAVEIGDEELRGRAYPALAAIPDPRVVPALINVMKPRPIPPPGSGGSSPPRAHVFFGEQRAFVQDFDVEIAQGAVIANPVIGILQAGSLLDVAVAGVQVISYTERVTVVKLLKKLTNQDFGSDPLAWEAWWLGQAQRPAGT